MFGLTFKVLLTNCLFTVITVETVNIRRHTSRLNPIQELYGLEQNKPFVSIWNVPSRVCETRYSIKFNLSFFGIDANSDDRFIGDEIVIFYQSRLGLYPWIDEDGQYVNGGLPQLADLRRHLEQTKADIFTYIPDKSFTGVAVIDWEEWRPIFERNDYDERQRVYIRASEDLVRRKHPDWSDAEIHDEAEKEFEDAARLFMQSTLSLCRKERPGGFWGFYGFPDCYNYGKGQRACGNDTLEFNNQLWWLFNTSSVLAPSIYLQEGFGTHEDRYLHVHGALAETRRVREKYATQHVPILPYTRFRYGDTGEFYDKTDLASTIKQSAYAGFNGVTFWDSSASFESIDDCERGQDYIQEILGPFVKQTTQFMTICSIVRCNAHGRCLNINWVETVNSDERLLSEKRCTMFGPTGWVSLLAWAFECVLNLLYDSFGLSLQRPLYEDFSCECFKDWSGSSCEMNIIENY